MTFTCHVGKKICHCWVNEGSQGDCLYRD